MTSVTLSSPATRWSVIYFDGISNELQRQYHVLPIERQKKKKVEKTESARPPSSTSCDSLIELQAKVTLIVRMI